ncbi:Histone-lysine N-methyltransferase, H3 lysine-9 specific SUVH1 [Hibiscus syriacus]|uniref:Histone-lysine N-methyltransferase, H3 lysine-9 specific SUVH1 n=1 Tax=Hibiscus syriacus TaxID=106335 RepID=A0A6A2YRZ2_HIBSY|nr:Histone-lysine N-methyltransferase, H3 lysine-9 specific SUVH1 [Hibiscus syriacus]
MDGGLGGNTVPTNTSDKSRVLDVKPLRILAPLFPQPPEGPPFVCAPPNGPFPSGFSPFFPFSGLQGSQSTPDLNQNHFNSTAVPLRSFRAEPPASGNGKHKHKSAGPSSVKRKAKRRKESESLLTSLMNFNPGISLSERDDGNRELVESVLLQFDALRRKLSQMEDAKELHSGIIKRADLKAANMLLTKGVRTNMKKRIGVVPGVEIGDIFFFRMELSLVGLHFPSMAGIDYRL